MGAANFNVSIICASAGVTYFTADLHIAGRPPLNATFPSGFTATNGLRVRIRVPKGGRARGGLTSPSALMLPQNPVTSDICAAALTGGAALSLLRFWGEMAKRGFFDQEPPVRSLEIPEGINQLHDLIPFQITSRPHYTAIMLRNFTALPNSIFLWTILNRKLVHISVGLVFMLFWPLFSSGRQGAVLAALVPGINIIRMVLVGLGIWKDEASVKSMSRHGDHRELLKGPLYYASAITLACAICWRSSPIAIAAICNLCAGDGLADLVGRRFGIQKLPYNRNKSFSGSLAMAVAGFLASIGYMHYFASFGYIQESWEMVFGFLVVSLASTLVESLPISSELDDNLTVPMTSLFLGTLVF